MSFVGVWHRGERLRLMWICVISFCFRVLFVCLLAFSVLSLTDWLFVCLVVFLRVHFARDVSMDLRVDEGCEGLGKFEEGWGGLRRVEADCANLEKPRPARGIFMKLSPRQ